MLLKLLKDAGELALHHGVGQLYLHARHHLLHQGLGKGIGGGLLLLQDSLLHDAAAQVGHILEALLLCKGIRQLGQAPPDDAVGLDVEGGILARQLRHILGGEGDVDIPLLLRADARYLLLEAGDKHPAAQQQGIAFALAAFEGYAVHEALEVQRDLVAHGGPVLLLFHQMLRQETLDGLVGVVIG